MRPRAWSLAAACSLALLAVVVVVSWRGPGLAPAWSGALRVTAVLAVVALALAVLVCGAVALRPPPPDRVSIAVPPDAPPSTTVAPHPGPAPVAARGPGARRARHGARAAGPGALRHRRGERRPCARERAGRVVGHVVGHVVAERRPPTTPSDGPPAPRPVRPAPRPVRPARARPRPRHRRPPPDDEPVGSRPGRPVVGQHVTGHDRATVHRTRSRQHAAPCPAARRLRRGGRQPPDGRVRRGGGPGRHAVGPGPRQVADGSRTRTDRRRHPGSLRGQRRRPSGPTRT